MPCCIGFTAGCSSTSSIFPNENLDMIRGRRRPYMVRRLILVMAMLGLALSASAQTLPTGVQKKASMGGITEYDFPNGLKVLLFPDASQPKFTVNVTYLVGS